ncbi:uncharacterized protein LOC132273867 [Cornus florida]|uniref:uncharacterized protein LOC132273867 n=1 Tax=Cornus florida TaxID=4283 RepID=UPI00289D9A15|nr:uncharacterized protein LOC132273867 [Cornus florida]XP_059630946.1 uncharacterized protein LOC132273867 [Cornus florida]
MMNILALGLVLTSLATAGVWSPSPDHEKQRSPPIPPPNSPRIIVKEGHRVVTVEYDVKKRDGNTKVSISPHQDQQQSHVDDDERYAETAKDKIKEASSVLPNVGQGLSGPNGQTRTPKELVCDAFGKCKHKTASALDKAGEKAKEVEEGAKEAVAEALGKAKEKVSREAQRVSEKAHEGAKEAAEKAMHGAEIIVEKSKTMAKEVKKNVSVDAEIVKEEAAKAAKRAKETIDTAAKERAHGIKEEGKKELKELKDILRRSGEVVHDAAAYLAWPETVDLLCGVVHLIGFSTAYGMCMWVTFASTYVLAEALPRQQFAMLQSKMYPIYFRAMACTVGVALLGHLLSQRKSLLSNMAEMFQCYNLLVAFFNILVNLYFLEPLATKVMFEKLKIEKEEGRGREGDSVAEPSSKVTAPGTDHAAPSVTGATTTTSSASKAERLERLNERLKKLNAYSSFLNIVTLMALTWHLVYLGQRLQTAS